MIKIAFPDMGSPAETWSSGVAARHLGPLGLIWLARLPFEMGIGQSARR